jgi:hypothetical protein
MYKFICQFQKYNKKQTKLKFSDINEIKRFKMLQNIPSRDEMTDTYYVTKQILQFKNKKLLIYSSSKSIIDQKIDLKGFGNYFTLIMSSFSFCYSFLYLNYSFAPFLFMSSLVNYYYIKNYMNHIILKIIEEIHLMEDCKTVFIKNIFNDIQVDIKFICKPNVSQLNTILLLIPNLLENFIPLFIDRGIHKGLYLLADDEKVEKNKELLNAVYNNAYISQKVKLGENDLLISL